MLTACGLPRSLAAFALACVAAGCTATTRVNVSRGDGRFVAFDSLATNLVPGDTNDKRDVIVRDTVAPTTTRASVATDGTQTNADSQLADISIDGRYVRAFTSESTKLVANDT